MVPIDGKSNAIISPRAIHATCERPINSMKVDYQASWYCYKIIACEQNYRVSFRTAAGLINEMVEARNENRLSLYHQQFKKIDFLD